MILGISCFQLDDEIVAIVRSNEDNSDTESDSDTESQPPVSPHAEAFNAFSAALKWLESQKDIEPAHLLLVKQWRDLAVRKRCNNLVQLNILTYFVFSS